MQEAGASQGSRGEAEWWLSGWGLCGCDCAPRLRLSSVCALSGAAILTLCRQHPPWAADQVCFLSLGRCSLGQGVSQDWPSRPSVPVGADSAHRTAALGWSQVLVPVWGSQEGPEWSHPRTAQVPSPGGPSGINSRGGVALAPGGSAEATGLQGQSGVPCLVILGAFGERRGCRGPTHILEQ